MSKIPSIVPLCIGLLILTACSSKEHGNNRTLELVSVKIMEVAENTISTSSNYSGTIEETVGTSLSFAVPGTIKEIYVKVGQHVSKGELVATIEDTNSKHSLEMSEATLHQAEDAYERMKQLHDNNSLPEIEWIDVETKLQQSKSAVEIARKNLADCQLYSPVSGIVSQKDIEKGQNVLPGTTVVKVLSIERVNINISIPETEIAKIKIGDEVSVTVPALDNQMFKGNINEKGIEANPISRTYQVKATVLNPERLLMPGMISYVEFINASEDKSIVIPASVVQLGSGADRFVWIANNGKALKKNIMTGRHTKNGIAVTNGLSAGDTIIIEGQHKVSEGSPLVFVK
ncbi:MAG: efflux RND transporter periplasmic adaptor subunit [Bacteroides sp.]|nr:efflux RND transporter periplasmic adaptor subunit [Bacteroides sp.]